MSDKKLSLKDYSEKRKSNFLRAIIEEDLRTNKHGGKVVTRFPPEPNGYLHIGHAKSICINFGLAKDYNGICHLRMDDTNPANESMEYVEAIKRDVRWLGFDWGDKFFFASDYFEKLYQFAEELILKGKAYVCELSEEEISQYRGTLTEPGKPSPYRDRPPEESLELFRRMRAGEFPDGAMVLRAKIDMSSPNVLMRDPIIYRIKHDPPHYRKGKEWCIYPMYDFTHCLSDALEGITHSFCTLEFENNRELYDWFIEHVDHGCDPPPKQYEFARLNMTYCVMSKRKLLKLVEGGYVSGWDDPRLPTIAGMRRRGYTPEAIRDFCDRIGVSKANSTVDFELLEYCVRNDLNFRAPRILCVLRPLKVVIENYPEDKEEEIEAPLFPPDVPKSGSRKLPFSREIYIERSDFMENPPKGFHRLSPGKEVRLRYAYVIKCEEVVKDPDTGEIIELRCTYDPDSKGRDFKRTKGIIHWVSAKHALSAEVRLYDRLFLHPQPDSTGDQFLEHLNPNSLEILKDCKIEPYAAQTPPGAHYQFERLGYFFADPEDSKPDRLVFNRTVTLKDTWSKLQKKSKGETSQPKAESKSKEEEKKLQKGAAKSKKPAPPKRSKAEQRKLAREKYPELAEKFRRYKEELGLPEKEADVLSGDRETSEFFEKALTQIPENPKALANWMLNELFGRLKGRELSQLNFSPDTFGKFVRVVEEEGLTSALAKQLLTKLLESGDDPAEILEREDLRPIRDPAKLSAIIDSVLSENPQLVENYRAGQKKLFGALMGKALSSSGGKADPKLLRELLQKKLDESIPK